jgi:enterochelin esterase-like enzyme
MKKSVLLGILLFVASAFAADQGTVLESLEFKSKVLDKKVEYSIYLPPDYESSTRHYPVVYLLHGFTDDETAWVQFGEVNLAADRASSERKIPPMIIVMPDAGVSWYINNYNKEVRFEDFMIDEFIPFIDSEYRTRAAKEFRGVSGLSMGGFGSLVFAMKNPAVFAACAAFSAGVHTDEEIIQMNEEWYNRVFSNLYGENLIGEERISEHFKQNNPLHLLESVPVEELKKVHWYIDCGDDDFLYKGNAALHIRFREREIPHEYRIRDGAHNWTYWRTHIVKGLKFIGESFHR